MKKIIAAILVCLMMVSLASCALGNGISNTASGEQNNPTTQSGQNGQNNDQSGTLTPNPVELVFHPATSPDAGAYATIKISSDIKFDDSTAWLGLCPAGKDYITELEADDVDVIWYNEEGREEESDPHVFACDFSDVEDGTYALVVTTSDDENIGYVVIQLEMTKSGDTLTFNYENAQIKERPAK